MIEWMKQPNYIIGVDEAGRGPLAGPVYVGLVYVPTHFDFGIFPKLNDSKRMTEKQREAIMMQLEESDNDLPIQTAIGYSDARIIDRDGIVPAISQAIQQGINKIAPNPKETFIYLDGSLQAPRRFRQETVIKGDSSLAVISLASVVAKVARDRYMLKIAEKYPKYNFGQHKGYGTKAHREAIQRHGPSDIHRQSFLTKILQ